MACPNCGHGVFSPALCWNSGPPLAECAGDNCNWVGPAEVFHAPAAAQEAPAEEAPVRSTRARVKAKAVT